MPIPNRVYPIIALSATLAAVVSDWLRPRQSLDLLIPPLSAAVALWLTRLLYRWQRDQSFARREKRRRTDPAEATEVPADTKKPEDFGAAVLALHQAQWQFLPKAVESQGHYFANGIMAAILPPFALLLLSIQVLGFPSGGAWAAGFALAETGCLGLLVCFAWSQMGPTATWERNRIRTELLRREQYLVIACVGPYLKGSGPEMEVEVRSRLEMIKGAPAASLSDLMDLREPSGQSWIEALYKERMELTTPPPDLLERIQSYAFMRISKQLVYFANEARDCGDNERLWTRLLKVATVAALVTAALHFSHLIGALETGSPMSSGQVAVAVVGIVLPPLGAALLGIQSMYAFGLRERLYERTKTRLHRYLGLIAGLLTRVRGLNTEAVAQWQDADFHFRVLVLQVEQVLSLELEQWHLLMSRKEPDVSP